MKLETKADWQRKARGRNQDGYEIYLDCANDGKGIDITTGKPLLSYDEWMNK